MFTCLNYCVLTLVNSVYSIGTGVLNRKCTQAFYAEINGIKQALKAFRL